MPGVIADPVARIAYRSIMAGQAHLLAPHHFPFLQRGKRRAAVLDIKSIYPAIMANGAFLCRVCLPRISQLCLSYRTYKTKCYGINCNIEKVLHLFMSIAVAALAANIRLSSCYNYRT
jgi:hypothetical protein